MVDAATRWILNNSTTLPDDGTAPLRGLKRTPSGRFVNEDDDGSDPSVQASRLCTYPCLIPGALERLNDRDLAHLVQLYRSVGLQPPWHDNLCTQLMCTEGHSTHHNRTCHPHQCLPDGRLMPPCRCPAAVVKRDIDAGLRAPGNPAEDACPQCHRR